MWEKELEIARQVSVLAGIEIMKIYEGGDAGVEYKEDHSPLTAADKASNAKIVAALKENFPSYAILSEEEKDNPKRLENDYCFVVDPLDGTKEFLKRNGQFTVNIALAYQHVSVMGVIYVPVTGELFFAAEGVGAYKEQIVIENGTFTSENRTALHVSDLKEKSLLTAVMSASHNSPLMEELAGKYQITRKISMGSSLKGCLVAEGKADVYFRHNPTMEWDTAAMQCIVEQAGGIFRQMDDTPMRYNREDSLNAKGFYAINCEENRLR